MLFINDRPNILLYKTQYQYLVIVPQKKESDSSALLKSQMWTEL